jgi:hypothetical protein
MIQGTGSAGRETNLSGSDPKQRDHDIWEGSPPQGLFEARQGNEYSRIYGMRLLIRRGGAPSGAAGLIGIEYRGITFPHCFLTISYRSPYTVQDQRVIFFTMRPSRKTVMPPPLWETTIPTAFVTLVIAATELCRVPIPGGRVTLLESTVM